MMRMMGMMKKEIGNIEVYSAMPQQRVSVGNRDCWVRGKLYGSIGYLIGFHGTKLVRKRLAHKGE
jgi:hypothetical protein